MIKEVLKRIIVYILILILLLLFNPIIVSNVNYPDSLESGLQSAFG